jgi:recombination protein RecR
VAASAGPEIERLIALLGKLPGLGPRSARRAALALLKRKDALLTPLSQALAEAGAKVRPCSTCGALDTSDPCQVCSDPTRDASLICVVEEVGALWALERAGAFRGRYHVLGGLLSALDGVGPEALRVQELLRRVADGAVREVILALPATVDGQTTAHYLADRLAGLDVQVTSLARGVPVGGDLDWLDEGTIATALRARRPASGV